MLVLHLLSILLLNLSLHLVVVLGVLSRGLGAVAVGRLAQW